MLQSTKYRNLENQLSYWHSLTITWFSLKYFWQGLLISTAEVKVPQRAPSAPIPTGLFEKASTHSLQHWERRSSDALDFLTPQLTPIKINKPISKVAIVFFVMAVVFPNISFLDPASTLSQQNHFPTYNIRLAIHV